MGLNKHYLLGFMSCVLVMGCAGFSYKYYGMKDVVWEHGALLGPKEKDDLPFSKCAPNSQSKFPCVVMFTKDFYAFKTDYEGLKIQLVDCQKAKKQ
jgi:hypothetical protein